MKRARKVQTRFFPAHLSLFQHKIQLSEFNKSMLKISFVLDRCGYSCQRKHSEIV